MSKRSEKISLIIPIYNVEQYLEECLLSVANQDYDNLEVIMVNDGSTDSSPDIAGVFADTHDHFKLINQKNGGLSAARNRGLKEAAGRYLTFLDSDDFIDSQMVSKMYRLITENSADIAKCGFLMFDDQTKEAKRFKVDMPEFTVIDTRDDMMMAYMNCEIDMVVWNAIYKRELFDGVRFPEGLNYEDHYATPKILSNAEKFVYTPEIYCYYRKRNGSVTLDSKPKDLFDKVRSLNRIYEILNKMDLLERASGLYSRYFYRLLKDYHNAMIYKAPGKLKKGEFAAESSIKDEAFELAVASESLTENEKKLIRMMKRSHYLCFIVQKLDRLKTIFNAQHSTNDTNRYPVPDEIPNRHINNLLKYA
jgi:glycosyltransferase involved in cell wall biosynthesis